MTSVMGKMPWMLWMVLSWTEENCVYKWHVMEDLQMSAVDAGVVVAMEVVETAEGGGPTRDPVPALAQETVTAAVIVAAQGPQGDLAAEIAVAEAAAAAEIKSP